MPRSSERGRFAPFATMPMRPKRSVNVSRMTLVSLYGYVWRTNAGSSSWRSRNWRMSVHPASISQSGQHSLVARPAALDAHPHLEEHLAAEQTLHVGARLRRDRLHPPAAVADHDRALARLLDDDRRMDAPKVTFVLEAVDDDRRSIRHLLAEQPEQLLANEFRGEKALVAIGDLRFGIERRPFRQRAHDLARQRVEIDTLLRRDRNDRGEIAKRRDLRNARQQCRFIGDRVDLVQRDDGPHIAWQQCEHVTIPLRKTRRIDNPHDGIDAFERVAHAAIE